MNGQLRTITVVVERTKNHAARWRGAAAPDLGPLNERLKQLEDATRTLRRGSQAERLDDDQCAAPRGGQHARRGGPAGRAVCGSACRCKAGRGRSELARAARCLAARGIPSEATLPARHRPRAAAARRRQCRQDKARRRESRSAGAGILDRLQSGVTKLVRIERDTGPDSRAPAACRQPGAVRREDLAATRQDVANLPQAADPQIQAWLKSVDAREAALAAVAEILRRGAGGVRQIRAIRI